jgi:hypothetical protein
MGFGGALVVRDVLSGVAGRRGDNARVYSLAQWLFSLAQWLFGVPSLSADPASTELLSLQRPRKPAWAIGLSSLPNMRHGAFDAVDPSSRS